MNPAPYDPKQMETAAGKFNRTWRDFETLRRELYKYILPPWFRPENFPDGSEQRIATETWADRCWQSKTGLPPLTSLEHLEIVKAAALAAGEISDLVGLQRTALIWALRRGGIDGRRIFWICDICLARCRPGEMPTIGTLSTSATCPICGKPTDDQRKFTPLFAKDIRPAALMIPVTAEIVKNSPIDLSRYPNMGNQK